MMSIAKRLLVVMAGILTIMLMMNSAFSQEHVWKAADGVYGYGPGDGYYSMFVVTDEGVTEPVNEMRH